MSELFISSSEVMRLADELTDLSRTLRRKGEAVRELAGSLKLGSGSAGRIRESLLGIRTKVVQEADQAAQLAGILAECAGLYKNADSGLARDAPSISRSGTGNSVETGAVDAGLAASASGAGHSFAGPAAGAGAASAVRGKSLDGAAAMSGKTVRKAGVKIKDKKSSRKTTIIEKGKSISASTVREEYELAGEYGSVHAETGRAEAHASAVAGVYAVNTAGAFIPSPEIKAEAGASICAASVKGEASYEGTYASASVEGEASAGKASASASAKLQIFDKKGAVNPRVTAAAGLEAVAVEAKGSAGGKIGVLEGKVNGSVNVGLGAHAEFGYADGKIKAEVGASLGLGASVGFELNVGGVVKAAKSGAVSMMKTFSHLINSGG